MPDALRLLHLTCATLALAAGTAAHGQEASEREQASSSRISPPQPDGPVIRTVAIPSPTPTARTPQQELGDPAMTPDLLAALQMCVDVVSPQFDANTQPLLDDSWSYTQPQRVQNAMGSFESVQYHKNDLVVALQDFGPVVQCRVVGRIGGREHQSEIRGAIIDGFQAVPIGDVPRLEEFLATVAGRSPDTDLNNVLVAGNYTFELYSQQRSTADLGITDPASVTLLLITSMPLPSQFQSE